MTDPDTSASFIGKWLHRWPEWRIAEAFVPSAQRRTATAWFALLQELTDSAWAGADPTPGLARLAWWQEELDGWAKGARRHPLGEVLQRAGAPWTPLARALIALPETREQPVDQAIPHLRALGAAVAACEASLFAATADRPDAEPARDSAVLALLGERALLRGAQDAAGGLLARWPHPAAGPVPRRLHSALQRARLQALAAGNPVLPPAGWRVLATSWRASRGR